MRYDPTDPGPVLDTHDSDWEVRRLPMRLALRSSSSDRRSVNQYENVRPRGYRLLSPGRHIPCGMSDVATIVMLTYQTGFRPIASDCHAVEALLLGKGS